MYQEWYIVILIIWLSIFGFSIWLLIALLVRVPCLESKRILTSIDVLAVVVCICRKCHSALQAEFQNHYKCIYYVWIGKKLVNTITGLYSNCHLTVAGTSSTPYWGDSIPLHRLSSSIQDTEHVQASSEDTARQAPHGAWHQGHAAPRFHEGPHQVSPATRARHWGVRAVVRDSRRHRGNGSRWDGGRGDGGGSHAGPGQQDQHVRRVESPRGYCATDAGSPLTTDSRQPHGCT